MNIACHLHCQQARTSAAAFTRIELLVVIATVAVLAAMLLPALSDPDKKSTATACLNNTRQLMLGWQMYAGDHGDYLPANDFPHTTALGSIAPDLRRNWVAGTMWVAMDSVRTDYLTDPQQTQLAVYVRNYHLYRCPADRSQEQGRSRTRSMSMNSAVGTRWHGASSASVRGREAVSAAGCRARITTPRPSGARTAKCPTSSPRDRRNFGC